MLGYNYPRKPITGEFAKMVREAAWRASTRNYNEEDQRTIQHAEEIKEKYSVTWNFTV